MKQLVSSYFRQVGSSVLVLAALTVGCKDGSSAPPPSTAAEEDFEPGAVSMRRLTSRQYESTLRALFEAAEGIEFLPSAELEVREFWLRSVNAGSANVTGSGMVRFEKNGRDVARFVLEEGRREAFVSCAPADAGAPDDACTQLFIESLGPKVLRRGLREGELEANLALARDAASIGGDFYVGLEAVLTTWLMSADFLFIQEQVGDEIGEGRGAWLTPASLASRLSYFLWNQGPDDELLETVLDGSLADASVFEAQLERMLLDERRLEHGVRAFFGDLYGLEEIREGVQKDPLLFPAFSTTAAEDAAEQTLRTIVDHVVVKRADYRDLFTTRDTFLSRALGPIYGAPVPAEWDPYTFPEDSPRLGILTHVSFLALHAHSNRSSPVKRGYVALKAVLCQEVGSPPADVSLDGDAPEQDGAAPTARERLSIHVGDPSCASCHSLIDPLGLALENFDAVGKYRETENSVLIDPSGTLNSVEFETVQEFSAALREDPRVTDCIVRKTYSHAVGRVVSETESEPLAEAESDEDEPGSFIDSIHEDFVDSGYDFVGLMRIIALSHGFRATSGEREVEGS